MHPRGALSCFHLWSCILSVPYPSLSAGDAPPGCSTLLPVAITGSGCCPEVLCPAPRPEGASLGCPVLLPGTLQGSGAPLGCPILLLLPFPDAALCALSLSRCWGRSPSTLMCPQGFSQLFPWPRRCSLGCLVVPWGTPTAFPWCPPGRAIVPAEVPGGQGQYLQWPRGGQRLPRFWGLHPQPGAGSAAAGSGGTGCVGTPRGTHTRTLWGTHTPRVAPSFPLPAPTSPRPHPAGTPNAGTQPRHPHAFRVSLFHAMSPSRPRLEGQDVAVTPAMSPEFNSPGCPRSWIPAGSIHSAPASHRFLRHHNPRCVLVLRMQDPELTPN